jgi:hypothetical protein
MPTYLWEILKTDAKKRRRPISKQIEIVLAVYYGFDDVEPDIKPTGPVWRF